MNHGRPKAPPHGMVPAQGGDPRTHTLMIPDDGPGLPGYLPLGAGPNTRGIPAWDALGALSQATPNNRGATRRIEAGQTLAVADLRAVPNVVARDLAVVLGLSVEGVEESFVTDEAVDSRVRACITWGIGSVEFSAELDWIDGTVVTIPAEQIAVRATYDRSFVGGSDPAPAPLLHLACGFGYGSRGKNSNPARLTEYVELLDTGDSKRVRIPNFATSFTVVLVQPSTSAQVDVYGFGKGLANRVVITAPMSNVGQYDIESAFPIRNGARFVEVTNTNQDGSPLRCYVVFGLAL